jgi:DNA modification methylase
MPDDQFRQFLRDAYVTADLVMKPGAVFYIWHADSEGYNFRGAAQDAGWKVRQCLIWKKSSHCDGADKITIGDMNLACMDGKKGLAIFGRQIASKPPYWSLISTAVTVNTQP